MPVALRRFLGLLSFWDKVYDGHSSERLFLELSSGIPFDSWVAMVELVRQDIAFLFPKSAAANGGDADDGEQIAMPTSSVLETSADWQTMVAECTEISSHHERETTAG